MLKVYSTCRWLQVCLGLIFVQYITNDCIFPPKKLQNGRFILQSDEDVNATTAKELYLVRFNCFKGYTLIGPRVIVCSEEKWSDVVPTCTKMQCSDPPVIENGNYKLHSGVNKRPTLGSIAVYSCNTGYELENDTISQLTCDLRKKVNTAYWKGDMPTCRKKESCPDPGVSPDGERDGDCCYTGDILHFSCNDGFQLVGEDEIQCLSTGSWSSWRPLCRPLSNSCDQPPPIMHGIVTGDKDGDYYLPWEEVEIMCEPGYTYRGPSKLIMCEEEGQWEDVFGNCTETLCSLPEPLVNGTILELESTNRTEFPFNFELTYVCDKGYRLEGGDSWRLCDTDGWSGVTPYCTAIYCPDPGAPEDGAKEGSSYEVGAKVRFKCSTGYFLMGSVERHCMPNGQWTGELARCDTDTNYCPNPGIPINGFKNSSNYDMGDVVGFGCRQGYIQVGSVARECLPDRTWSGKETVCLGPYDFDNSAQIRDQLKITMSEKAAEQKNKLKKFREAQRALWDSGNKIGRTIDLNHPGRLILYFIFDVSGSVGRINFEKSINFAKAVVKKVGISNVGARAGALTFSSKAEIKFLPLDFTTTDEVLNALDEIEYTGGGTSATSALTLVREECIPLTQGVLGKKGQKSIIFILTDGRANMGGDPQTEANALKTAGVEIYCIGITGKVQKDTLYKIASDSTEEQHVFILESYATLSWLIQELTNGTVDYSQCGLGMEKAGSRIPRGRVVDGSRASEPWPWMTAVFFLPPGTNDPTGAELKCGGSIINKFFILTAAHCMYYSAEWHIRDVKEVIVKLGLTHVKNETFLQEPEVKSFFIHPKYRPGKNYDYDIALLQLSKAIEFNAYVRPICLPPPEIPEGSYLYKPQEYALATGWGHEGIVFRNQEDFNMQVSEHLKELILPIQSREACNKSLVQNRFRTEHFTERMLCAGDEKGGNDTCGGDSGGPLMQSQLNEEGNLYWTQVGIVSWGIGCGLANTFGFYSHVTNLRSWIDQQINDALAMEM